MNNLLFRRFSTLFDHVKGSSNFNPRMNPNTLPVPHRTIPEPRGQDHDFVTVAHSHLIHAEWSKLNALASGLNPFRTKHILLKIRRDPVISFEFYRWAILKNPNSQTLETHSMILHILTKAKRFKSAESLLRETLIPRTLHSSSELFDALLYSYRLCDSSPGVFDSLFKTYAHMKKFRNVTETFCRMRDYGFLPTIQSCNAYMNSLLNLDRTDIVLAFYREMGRCRISPNVYTLNMVICALCNLGKLEKALDMFGKMESMGVTPTVSSFNTLIAGYCKNGLTSAAMKLKNEMCNKGLDPNIVTYNTLIHGLCKEGRLNEANKILSEMKAMDVNPNTVTYNTLINGYSQMSNSEMGSRLYEEMVKNKVETDILTYNALILGFCNEGKSKKAAYLVKELDRENLVPNASTFSALIRGQCNRQNSERAFQIYKAMRRNGYYLNSEIFKLLISTFCKNKDFEGAFDVLQEMLEGWMVPDKNLLTELFEGLCRSGKSHLVTGLRLEVEGGRLIPEGILESGFSINQLENGSY